MHVKSTSCFDRLLCLCRHANRHRSCNAVAFSPRACCTCQPETAPPSILYQKVCHLFGKHLLRYSERQSSSRIIGHIHHIHHPHRGHCHHVEDRQHHESATLHRSPSILANRRSRLLGRLVRTMQGYRAYVRTTLLSTLPA